MIKYLLPAIFIFCIATSYSQTHVNDTVYYFDDTFDIGEIIESSGQFITLKTSPGHGTTIYCLKEDIIRTSNPNYNSAYFDSYRRDYIGQDFNKERIDSEEGQFEYLAHDYAYYDEQYKKAKRQNMTGKYFTFGGLLCFIGGAALFVIENPSSSFNTYDNQAHNNQGLFMMLGGEIMMDIGIPLWISGSIKASNNLKAREKSNLTSFELSTKGLGAQLILHF